MSIRLLLLAFLILISGCAIGNQEEFDPFADIEPGSAKIQINGRMYDGKAEYKNNQLFINEIKRPDIDGYRSHGSMRIRFRDADLVKSRYDLVNSNVLIEAYNTFSGGSGYYKATSGSVTIDNIGVGYIEGSFEFSMKYHAKIILFPSGQSEYKGRFIAQIIEDE
jgi:hypothetical protein